MSLWNLVHPLESGLSGVLKKEKKECVCVGGGGGGIIIIGVISVVPNLTDEGEYSAFYRINKNVCIKTSKIIIVLWS